VAGITQQLVGGEDAVKAFMRFYDETEAEDILSAFDNVCEALDIHPERFPDFFPVLRKLLEDKLSYKYKEMWKILDKKSRQSCYSGNKQSSALRVLVIGAGPVGLRTAIEAQLLGCRTVVVEGRTGFTRNNVLKLWKFLIEDLKQLGVKKLYGKFCSGNINHICIKTLQTALLKICCMLGVQVYTGVKFLSLNEPEDDMGWHARLQPEDHEARHFSFDAVLGASGKAVNLEGFKRYKLDAKLAIAITCNFDNEASKEEAFVNEISGVQKQYHQHFFTDLMEKHGIGLENLIYYKDLTHYFVMTATKESLLKKGVLLSNFEDRNSLLSPSNVNKTKLAEYAKEACLYATGYYSRRLPHTNFATNSRGEPDLAIFDFTNLYAARNSCRAVVRKGFPLLMGIVGDSLLEPFWPDGTGCARGFLSALDAAWMLRSWSLQSNPLGVLEERENLYSMLSQTTDENLNKNFKNYSLDPRSRYKNIPRPTKDEKILALYDTDNKEEMRYLEEKFLNKTYFDSLAYQNITIRYRAIKTPFSRQMSFAGASKVLRVLGKKTTRAKESLLSKLGKTNVTSNTVLAGHVDNFKSQMAEVVNIQEDLASYRAALEQVELAESKLMATWGESIKDWNNLENFLQNAEGVRQQRLNNLTNLDQEVMVPLLTYREQFQDMKGRIDKCEARRADYDRAVFLAKELEMTAPADRLEAAKASAEKAGDRYEVLVEELGQELPLLYGARRQFFADNLLSFFGLQKTFHTQVSYIFGDMSEYVLIKLKHD